MEGRSTRSLRVKPSFSTCTATNITREHSAPDTNVSSEAASRYPQHSARLLGGVLSLIDSFVSVGVKLCTVCIDLVNR